MRPTRAANNATNGKGKKIQSLAIDEIAWKLRQSNTYIDRRANHLNGIKSVPKHLKHRCFLVRNTKISYCNHKSSRKKPTTPGDSANVLSNSANSFERADCLIGV